MDRPNLHIFINHLHTGILRPFPHPTPQGVDGAGRLLGDGDHVQLHDGGVLRRHQHGLTRIHTLQHGGLRGRRTILLRDTARPSGLITSSTTFR